jgi:hypothetical protein
MIHILEIILNELQHDVFTEVKFCNHRKFRFDYLIKFSSSNKIKGLAIEYEGLSYRNANRSGHQSFTGYVANVTKYNLALSMGYLVLRYTCKQLEDPDKVKNEILETIKLFEVS